MSSCGVHDIETIIDTYRRVIGPTKVLIVDDSMTVRKIVQKVLTDENADIDALLADAQSQTQALLDS